MCVQLKHTKFQASSLKKNIFKLGFEWKVVENSIKKTGFI